MNRHEYQLYGAKTTCLRGADLPQSKLTPEIVKEIRLRNAEKERMKRELDARHSATALASEFGVSRSAIEKVLSYQTWGGV